MKAPLSSERIALLAFIGNATFAGGNAVMVRFSNRDLAPLWGAGLRFAVAALLLMTIMAILKLPAPRGAALRGAIQFGLLAFGGGFGLLYFAFVEIHAGLGMTLMALVPLATLVLAVAQRQERLHGAAVAGTLLALAGMAIMSSAPLQAGVPPVSLLALLGGVLCFAQAGVSARGRPPLHPVTMNAFAMATGAIVLLLASLAIGEPRVLPVSNEAWIALVYLVVVGSGVVFVLYLVVLRHWSASRAAYAFVIIPFITVALSAVLDNEPIGAGLVLGGLVLLAGVYVGALRPATSPPSISAAGKVA